MKNPKFKNAEQKIYYLSSDELRRFFAVIPKKDKQSRAMFLLIYRYGLRVAEAANLKIEDLQSDGRIYIRAVKNGFANHYRVSDEDRKALDEYLEAKKRKSDYIFSGRTGGRINTSTIFRIYRKFSRLAGLDKSKQHPHCLRHSIAVAMLDGGLHIEDVQDWLRHRNIKSSMVYARITSQRRDKSAEVIMKENFDGEK